MTDTTDIVGKRIDRAAVVAATIMQILDTTPYHSLRRQIELCLRDEISDLERQIAADRDGPDA